MPAQGRSELSHILSFPVFVNYVVGETATIKQKQMKKMFLTSLLWLHVGLLLAQTSFTGKIIDQQSKEPIAKATIMTTAGQTAVSDEQGNFRFTAKQTSLTTEVSAIGYQTWIGQLSAQAITIALVPSSNLMKPIEINAVRAADKSPFTQTTITSKGLQKLNLGQDIPFLLNQTPSVVINSDAGNGVGYTGIRIRGTDATRINMTINGIPYNDAESQGLFFVNLPDIMSSVNSLQIQRGVGTSSNGAGAFGATMNLLTNEVREKAYTEINNSIGSFNTFKNTIKTGTGLLNDHFTFDARLSRVKSDGFIDRASSNMQSFYVSSAYLAKKSSLRLNVFSGKEKTYQAWYGIPEDMLTTNRTYNSAGTDKPGTPYDNETDNYKQTHYQLFYNQSFSKDWSMNIATFYTKGAGYYEQYKADQKFSKYGLPNYTNGTLVVKTTDVIRQLWLDNNFYGNTFSIQKKNKHTDLLIGGGWNQYDGNHIGKLIWGKIGIPADYTWYHHTAFKADKNLFAKWQEQLNDKWSLFGDLQYRHVRYDIYGFRDNPSLIVKNNWNFINPKLGIHYTKGTLNAYASFAVSNKEPNRDDFEAGAKQQPVHESLRDLEIGVENRKSSFAWGATFYYMYYKNQLVLTGQVNDVGAYTRTNIPISYRAGIELTTTWKPINWFDLSGNITLSKNKIKNSVVYYDDYDNGGQIKNSYSKADIAFSPNVTGAATLNFRPSSKTEISLLNKYVSRQYLDNASLKSRSLDPYFLNDIRFSYQIHPKFMKEILLIGQVNNILNVKYEPNGYTFSYIWGGSLTTENYYYPMAGTNVMVGLNLSF